MKVNGVDKDLGSPEFIEGLDDQSLVADLKVTSDGYEFLFGGCETIMTLTRRISLKVVDGDESIEGDENNMNWRVSATQEDDEVNVKSERLQQILARMRPVDIFVEVCGAVNKCMAGKK